MTRSILLIEDEVSSRRVLSAALTKDGFSVDSCDSAEAALNLLEKGRYNLILSDYKLPGMSGEALLDHVRQKNSLVPFILVTGHGTIERAVDAMRKGAYTYLTKPVDLKLVVNTVKDALREADRQFDDTVPPYSDQFLNIIGKSPPIQEVFSMIQRVGKTDASVLVLGESGTGKELVARAIHYTSLRADKPFIPIDCTTIPTELMESELFGYDKGAFSCAYNDKIGLIEMAEGGTVFFDEIGDLDFSLQKKLLRFLQEKDFQRLGGKKRINANVRVLAATNRDVEQEVERGQFRADLYYRLNVISVFMPALRERGEDVPILANHFLASSCKKNKKDIRGFDSRVLDIFSQYDWPGNVRELENVVERAVILCPYDQINVECLPKKMIELDEEPISRDEELNLGEIERRAIVKALDATAWNQSQAAVRLGISRKQLRTKMKNLDLLPGKPRSAG